MSDSKQNNTVLTTPLLRFSYVYAFSPKMPPNPKPNDKARYSVVGMFMPPANYEGPERKRLVDLVQAVPACFIAAYGKDKYDDLIKEGKFGNPFRKDFKSAKLPTEGFSFYIRPWNNNPVSVLTNIRGPDGRPTELKDPNQLWSGCWGRLLVHPFAYDAEKKNWGVSFGLDGVQKIKEDERLDNRVDAAQYLDAELDAAAAEAGNSVEDLTSLLGGP